MLDRDEAGYLVAITAVIVGYFGAHVIWLIGGRQFPQLASIAVGILSGVKAIRYNSEDYLYRIGRAAAMLGIVIGWFYIAGPQYGALCSVFLVLGILLRWSTPKWFDKPMQKIADDEPDQK